MKMELYSLLLDSAYSALKRQGEDGAMPHGHNGPWGCHDTPVRNTANWLKLFLFAYRQTADEAFLSAGKKSLDYMLSEKARPYHAAFYCRRNEGRNKTNGLIGQAWVLEALVEYYVIFQDTEVISVAKDVFMLHDFDEIKGLWHEIDIDGSVGNLGKAFNQQLWFAVMGAKIAEITHDAATTEVVSKFVEKMPLNFDVCREGIIRHVLTGRRNHLLRLKRLSSNPLKYLNRLQKIKQPPGCNKKGKTVSKGDILSLGYHSFNLYAFALLKKMFSELVFWRSVKFKKALRFITTSEYEKKLENNDYGFGYNVTGIEIAYTLSVFKENSEEEQKYWLQKQFLRNYDFQENLLNRNACDPETLSARLYEATRIGNIELNQGRNQ